MIQVACPPHSSQPAPNQLRAGWESSSFTCYHSPQEEEEEGEEEEEEEEAQWEEVLSGPV